MGRRVVPIHFSEELYRQIEGYRAESKMKAFSAAAKELMAIGYEVVRGGIEGSKMEGYIELSEKLEIEMLMILRRLAKDTSPQLLEEAQTAAKNYYLRRNGEAKE